MFIHNATIDIDGAMIKADSDFSTDESYSNHSAYVEVEANASNYASLTKSKRFAQSRGRPSKYDRDAIRAVFRKRASAHKGTFAAFVRENNEELAAASGTGKAPDRTWLSRNFQDLYDEMRRK
jgi:DNA-binding protein H-NS